MGRAEQSKGPTVSSHSEDLVVRVPADEVELSRIRSEVRRYAEGVNAPDDVVADLELVVSELSTNVIQHSGADEVTVSLRHHDGSWQVDVHHFEGLRDLSSVVSPPHSSTSGRGIMVVRALMDDVEIIEEAGGTLIRCTRRT